VVPAVLPALLRSRRFRRVAFWTVLQTAIKYRGSMLSGGHPGVIHGGDRWAGGRVAESGHATANLATLTSLHVQGHIYGAAAHEIRALCGDRGLPLHEFAWQSGMARAGVRRNALYLVRPDGYVALATANQSAAELASYLDAYSLR